MLIKTSLYTFLENKWFKKTTIFIKKSVNNNTMLKLSTWINKLLVRLTIIFALIIGTKILIPTWIIQNKTKKNNFNLTPLVYFQANFKFLNKFFIYTSLL